jgi:hypothetical protein
VTWQPGTPIRTEEDWREWQEWRKESILVAQRKRRAKLRRIDYADVREMYLVKQASRGAFRAHR